jgi:hypothetical protein
LLNGSIKLIPVASPSFITISLEQGIWTVQKEPAADPVLCPAVLVPFIALFFGVYPLVLNRDFALAATLYFTASSFVTSVSMPEDAYASTVCHKAKQYKLLVWQPIPIL